MKAKLEFDLPEENYEFSNAINGANMRSVLWEFDQWLRGKIKYDHLTDEEFKTYQNCRDHLRNLLNEENIDLDK